MLFSDPFRDIDSLAAEVFGSLPRRIATPAVPMDAWRDEEALHLEFEVPGVSEEQLSLEVERGTLTLTIDRPLQEVAGQRLRSERSYGRSSRSLTIGDGLDTDRVEARLDRGVLSLTIPIAERVKPKRIAIASGEVARELTSSTAD